LSNFS